MIYVHCEAMIFRSVMHIIISQKIGTVVIDYSPLKLCHDIAKDCIQNRHPKTQGLKPPICMVKQLFLEKQLSYIY